MIPSRIIIHCSATKNGKSLSVDTIRKWHLKRGWKDIGYHGVIDIDGTWTQGRPNNVQGAGVLGENKNTLHICLVGDTKFSIEQFKTLGRKIDAYKMIYSIKDEQIFTHAQFPSAVKQGKTCPNIPINNLLVWYMTYDMRALNKFLIS